MFDELAQAIRELKVLPYGDSLTEILSLRDRLDAKITAALGEFDAESEWGFEGDTSLTAWLRHNGHQTGRDAARLSVTAKRLRKLPATAEAFADGRLSGGQVAAIVANVSQATVEMFAEQESELLPHLIPLPVRDVTKVMQAWRQHAEALLDDAKTPAEPKRDLHHSETLDGRWVTNAEFDPEGGTIVDEALRHAATPDREGDPVRSPGRRRADALVDVCRWYLEHYPAGGTKRGRPHLDVTIDFDALDLGIGSLRNGTPLDRTTVRRLLCDAKLNRVVMAGASTVLDYGRTSRIVPPNLWAAVVARDKHCRHPGCDRRPGWCQAHHVKLWSQGGTTELANLILGCTRHHHLWHAPGWTAKLLANGEVHVTRPDGQVMVSRPPP